MFKRVLFASYSCYKSKSGNIPGFQHQDAIAKRQGFAISQGLRFINNNIGIRRALDANNNFRPPMNSDQIREKNSLPGNGSGPSKFNFFFWAKCLLCSVLSFFLPKWAKLKMIEDEAEMVIEEVENVAEVVEKVATVAEKVSAEVAEMLPDDSKLKKVAMVVEHVSEVTAQDAHAATQFIHQVEAIKNDTEGLESLVDTIVEKIVKQQPEEK